MKKYQANWEFQLALQNQTWLGREGNCKKNYLSKTAYDQQKLLRKWILPKYFYRKMAKKKNARWIVLRELVVVENGN